MAFSQGILYCLASSLLLSVAFYASSSQAQTTPQKQFPAFFIFGDSVVDVGNNNYISSVAKATQPPFGIDFPLGPTGRFTNGKTVLDVIADLIFLPYPPPYLAPSTSGQAILKGVNYASGAGGILQSSGFNFIGRADFDTQIDWFGNTVQQLQGLLGASAAQDLLAKSLFATVFGSNDYVNNYLLRYSPINKVYTPTQFQDVVLQKTASQLTQLYKLGARNVAVAGLGPLGCIPSQLVRQKSVNGECSDYVNKICADYNLGLIQVLQRLNSQLPGAKFLYADNYYPTLEYRTNPSQYGFQFGNEACCGRGKYKGQLLCLPFVKPCPDRYIYIFWDAFHPTEHANTLLGNRLYSVLNF